MIQVQNIAKHGVRPRLTGRDPFGKKGGLNQYGFVHNNPNNGWDYLGLVPLNVKLLGRYVYRSIRATSLGPIGIMTNWWTAGNRVVFKDEEHEMEQKLSDNMDSFFKEYLTDKKNEGRLTGDYQTIHIPLTDAVQYLYNTIFHSPSREPGKRYYRQYFDHWNIHNDSFASLGYLVGGTKHVWTTGILKAKIQSSTTRRCKIKYKHVNTLWSWHDKLDAHSFQERLDDDGFSDRGSTISSILEGYVDLMNEKINGSDYDYEIRWPYKDGGEHEFTPFRGK